MKLAELIRQERFASTGQEALLSVIVTGNWLLARLAAMMVPYGITPAQYNVLRILRGSHPESLTCSEIGQRLLDRTPDVTRLLNRLEKAGFVRRARDTGDRRIVQVNITEKGLALLAEMQPDMEREQASLTAHLDAEEHRQLAQLLERMRADQNP